MKLFLPKQHGAWAMLIVPFWLGVIGSGFLWEHIPFFFGWLLLYLSTYPMLLLFKKKKIQFYAKWSAVYMVPAILLLLFPLFERPSIFYFGLMMIPFFMINAFFSSQNNDRAVMNDFSAIFAFSLAGVASGYLANGEVYANSILVFVVSSLFFIGSTLYVKTMIREKKNEKYKWISWGYHFIVPIAFTLSGNLLVMAAFLPSLVRAIKFYGKPLSPKQIGIYEIVNSAIFFSFITIYFLTN